MKTKVVQFVPLGREMRAGDYIPSESSGYEGSFLVVRDAEHAAWLKEQPRDKTAYKREVVEVDVPDPVPEFIRAAEAEIEALDDEVKAEQAGAIHARHFRAHVEKRAKSAADLLTKFIPGDDAKAAIIREEFLR